MYRNMYIVLCTMYEVRCTYKYNMYDVQGRGYYVELLYMYSYTRTMYMHIAL